MALNPRGSEGQQGVGTSIRSLSPHHNECESSYDCISPDIPIIFLRIIGKFLGIIGDIFEKFSKELLEDFGELLAQA